MVVSPASCLGVGVMWAGDCVAITDLRSWLKTYWFWANAARFRVANKTREDADRASLFFIVFSPGKIGSRRQSRRRICARSLAGLVMRLLIVCQFYASVNHPG